MTHYEVKFPIKGKDGKTYWSRCGTAFPTKQGDGFTIVLDAVPVPVETGPIKLAMWPPKPKDGGQTQSRSDLNDDIPF